ncbi:MAG: phosphatidate cytidylyltransferase [Candidatus Tokpelaia sp. JSC188]|nr:MAG: phosphatidate cytidylyltransferase [Candidatus Tokpelaia sp. JSC188]
MTANPPENKMQTSNLQLRILTSIPLAILVLGLTWIGEWPFGVFILLMGGGVFYEWNILVGSPKKLIQLICGWFCYLAVSLVLLAGFSVSMIFLVLLAGIFLLIFLYRQKAYWIVGGFAYSTLLVVTLFLLRENSFDCSIVYFLYAVVWGTDVGAYFFGRAFGGAKLVPKLSPNKTWSGAIGGAAIGVLCGECIAIFMMHVDFTDFSVFILALFLSFISQIGDVSVSSIKRYFQVKDSGNILPGHGGIMDRVDSLMAASVALYVVRAFISDFSLTSNLFNFLQKIII